VQTSYGAEGGIGLHERGRVWTAPTSKFFKIHFYEEALISPLPDLLPDVVGRNR